MNIAQTPPLVTNAPTLVAPTPISGMVPIRNPLYDQAGLTSSVLLQPLNEVGYVKIIQEYLKLEEDDEDLRLDNNSKPSD